MNRVVQAAALSLLALSVASAVDRKTIYLERMSAMAPYIKNAAVNQKVKAEFVEEAAHSDFRVLIGPKFSSLPAQTLYRKNTGRTENATVEVVDMKTRRTIMTYDFTWPPDETGLNRVAGEFVRQLKSKLNN